jgi:hypothetical protein
VAESVSNTTPRSNLALKRANVFARSSILSRSVDKSEVTATAKGSYQVSQIDAEIVRTDEWACVALSYQLCRLPYRGFDLLDDCLELGHSCELFNVKDEANDIRHVRYEIENKLVLSILRFQRL